MMIFADSDKSEIKVKKMYEYMVDNGLKFKSINFYDSSPYAILNNRTSIGYRDKSKWGQKGIVFFCAKDGVDRNALESKLKLHVYDNSDKVRPYAIFIPNNKFIDAVAILKENPDNMQTDDIGVKYEAHKKDSALGFISIGEKEEIKYKVVDVIDKNKNIMLVEDCTTNQLFVRKKYSTYSEDVFKRLMEVDLPGIPAIKQVAKNNNVLYTIEEYVPGIDLLKLYERDGILCENEIFDIAIKICDILEKLHSLEPPMIHRDIKPSNIIKKEDGSIVLIDFNASRLVNNNSNQDTQLFGTQFFGAPEQFLGYGQSDQTADIFALGATMTYLATGLFHNQLVAPGKFHNIWKRCVSMDKNDRYQSVTELKYALLDANC